MLEYISYDKLVGVMNNVKPYRKTDRYPLAKRTHRGKYMIPKEVNGKMEFHVCYHWRHNPIDITDAEYKKLSSDEQQNYHWCNRHGIKALTEAERIFRKYDRTPNVVVVIRDDNTAEFVAEYLGQGDRGFLSYFSHGYFTTSVRKGGGLYKRGMVEQPVFRGLRLDITTHEPHESCNYEVISRVVDRKKAKHVLAEFERPFTIAEAMLKGYSLETFFADVHTMRVAVDDANNGETNIYLDRDKYKETGIKLLNTDEVGGAMLLMIHKDYSLVNRAQRYMNTNVLDSWQRNYGEPIDYFTRMKKTVHREIYKECNALKERVHKHGDHIPTSTWDVEVKLNGNTVKPY